MAHDVGHGLAQRQRHRALLNRGQVDRIHLGGHSDPGPSSTRSALTSSPDRPWARWPLTGRRTPAGERLDVSRTRIRSAPSVTPGRCFARAWPSGQPGSTTEDERSSDPDDDVRLPQPFGADREQRFGPGDAHRQHPGRRLLEVACRPRQHPLHPPRAASRPLAEDEERRPFPQPVARGVDGPAGGARHLPRRHDGILGRQAAVLRGLHGREAEAGESAPEAGVDLGSCDHGQAIRERGVTGPADEDLEQVGVGVREVVRDDDDGPAGHAPQVLAADQLRAWPEHARREQFVDTARQGVLGVVAPVRADEREAFVEGLERVRPGLVDAAGQRPANAANRRGLELRQGCEDGVDEQIATDDGHGSDPARRDRPRCKRPIVRA